MKILQVIHGYPMRYNAGSEVYSQTLCHGLADNHEVHVFTREEDPFAPDFRVLAERDPDDSRIALHVVNNPRNRYRYRDPRIDRQFADILDREKPDVVHVGHLLHAFGFYEGRAAVAAPDGWHHILPDGSELYAHRFAWCGNFQDRRCAVREFSGAYLHITPGGDSAYEARWRYAGDYRDGAAVAQSDDGRSTHIGLHGNPIHGVRYFDLDVFHKACARARDGDGWMHIDATGCPLYGRRFAAVEPFYNGQARVERFDGGLEVIDEKGTRMLELRPALKCGSEALRDVGRSIAASVPGQRQRSGPRNK